MKKLTRKQLRKRIDDLAAGRGGAIDIDDLVAEKERDPVMREALSKARQKLAAVLHRPGSPEYERMKRGKGPRSHH